jgi:nitrogen regulatory protein PII-like uncharacterized protein
VKNLENKPFALLGVNVDCYTADQLKKVVAKEKLLWRSFVDPRGDQPEGFPGRISNQWNLEGTPTFYLIDHKGVIRYKWLGDPGERVIDEAIEKLVKEAEQAGKR